MLSSAYLQLLSMKFVGVILCSLIKGLLQIVKVIWVR